MPDIDVTDSAEGEQRFCEAIAVLMTMLRDLPTLDEFYQAVVDGAMSISRADSAGLQRIDETAGSAVTIAAAGTNTHELLHQHHALEASLAGQIIRTGQPTLIEDAAADHKVWQPAAATGGIRAVIAVPISGANNVFGVLGANTTSDGRIFTQHDLELLVRYSAVAGVGIETVHHLLDRRESSSNAPASPHQGVQDLRPLSDFDDVGPWAMVETSPDGMILTDERGVMLLVNAQIEVLFGYDRGELLGRPVEELLPQRHRRVHTAHRTRYRVDPKPRSMGSGLDLLARRKDDTEFPVEVSLAPVTTDIGLRVVATVRDVTERKAGEAFSHAVQHSIDAAQDGVFMFRPDTLEFTYVNKGATHQLGYSRSELLAMTPLHIKPEFTDREFRELLKPLLEDKVASHEFITMHRGKDGSDVPVEIIIEYPPPASPGQPRMLVAFVRNITERVQATQALEASEAAFRTTFEAAPVGIAIVDFTDSVRRPIADCNQALCDLLGYTKAELLTKGFADLTHPDDAKSSDSSAQLAASGAVTQYEMEKRYLHANGYPVWVWVHSAVLPDAAGNPTRGMVHVADLTERKQAEAERERGRQWLTGLGEIRAAALADESLEHTLELVCSHARKLIGADTAVIARPNDAGDRIYNVAFDSPETRELLPAHFVVDEPLRQALAGQSFLSSRLDRDSRVDDLNRTGPGALEAVTAVLVVPIGSDASVDALLCMSHRHENGISENDLTTIESFAAEAATVLQLHEARRAAAKLQVLEDRERLARDLHDLVIQRLFAAGMALQSVLSYTTNPTVAERVSATVEQLDQTISELRNAIFRLNTPTAISVANQLNAIVDAAAIQLGFQPEVNFHGDPESIPENILEQLSPTLTEALSNVARHANATTATITVTIAPTTLELTVSDNGVGIDADAAHGSGLRNLSSRAQRVGGHAALINNTNAGATLTWTATR